jgi:uncharacterized protein (DUF1810 family)
VSLTRFLHAQDQGSAFAAALAELRAGAKRGHWIWFVFPQLRGLGVSPMADHFGIEGREEAQAYLGHPVLRSRLREAMAVVRDQLAARGASLRHLMGSHIDALKLVSSLTLFERVARTLHAVEPCRELAELAAMAGDILDIANAQGYPRCRFTLDATG